MLKIPAGTSLHDLFIKESLPIEYEFFLHSSYEDRSASITQFLLGNICISSVHIISSDGYSSSKKYRDNHVALKSYFPEKNTVHEYSSSKHTLIDVFKEISKNQEKTPRKSIHTILDLSTFPRREMAFAIGFIERTTGLDNLSFLYSTPQKYATENGVKNGEWLSKGVKDISPIPSFNGRQKTNKQRLLVCYLGHEVGRLHMALRNLEPEKICLIQQSEVQYRSGLEDISQEQANSIDQEYKGKVIQQFSLGAYDVVKSYQTLRDICREYEEDYNISVLIQGTKLQALGAILYSIENKSIEIIHAKPAIYNMDDYSSGIGDTFLFDCKALLSASRTIG